MNSSSKTLTTMLGVTLLLPMSVVSAGPDHEGGHNRFMNFFDTNSDNQVTYDEFLGASKDRFTRIDADKNGVISEDEFASYIKNRREQRQKDRIASMDTNKDGKISKEEFIAHSQQRAERRFGCMDKNHDDQLSNDELASRKDHKRHFGKKVFSRIDSNSDGQVTQEESQAAWGKWFERMDSNGDKIVTADEINQAREKWRRKWND